MGMLVLPRLAVGLAVQMFELSPHEAVWIPGIQVINAGHLRPYVFKVRTIVEGVKRKG